jgi:hypothetical protein
VSRDIDSRTPMPRSPSRCYPDLLNQIVPWGGCIVGRRKYEIEKALYISYSTLVVCLTPEDSLRLDSMTTFQVKPPSVAFAAPSPRCQVSVS